MMRKGVLMALAVVLVAGVAAGQDLHFPFAEGFAAAHPGDPEYQKGLSQLDAQQWDKAVATFSASAMKKKTGVADASLYWKAFAENKLGRADKALTSLAVLQQAYPSSRWMNDAKALALEVRAQEGRPVNPLSPDLDDLQVLAQDLKALNIQTSHLDRANVAVNVRTKVSGSETGDPEQDLKLIAVNSLMQSDPSAALPILQKVLANNNNSDKVKERALFVLTQNRSGEARKILLDTARSGSDNGLRMKAINFMGMMGGEDAQKDLASLYSGSSDPKVKSAVLKSYMMSGSKASLLAAAKSEKDPALRSQAIKELAMAGGKDEMWELYRGSGNDEDKKQFLRSMVMTGDSQHLLEIAKTDKDPAVRAAAVKALAMTGRHSDDGESVVSIYKSDASREVRKAALDALFMQQDGKALVELARAEKDPAQKLEIVRKMSMIQSPETKAYMLEVLK